MTQPPSADEQLTFLTNFQRLLAEGQFVATYKYALLLALADLAVEDGNDSGAEMPIQTRRIAEKFIELYWRQAVPYVPRHQPDAAQVLRQNTGPQAEVVGRVEAARARYGGSLADARRDIRAWQALVNHVDRVVRVMPLWRLQTVGTQALPGHERSNRDLGLPADGRHGRAHVGASGRHAEVVAALEGRVVGVGGVVVPVS